VSTIVAQPQGAAKAAPKLGKLGKLGAVFKKRSADLLVIKTLPQTGGSPRESDEVGILSGFLEGDEFGLGSGQSLCLEQEIVDVTVAPASAKDRLDISVDRFHHA
jgi:hypothetical protein